MLGRTVRDLREAADAVLHTVDLAEVWTVAANFSSSTTPRQLPLNVDAGLTVGGSVSDRGVEARATYRLTASSETSGEVAWNAEVTCVALFEPEDSPRGEGYDKHDADDIEAFAAFVGAPLLHPYAREVVQSLTARSPYPAFTLGLLTPIGMAPDDEVVTLATERREEETGTSGTTSQGS